MIASMGAMYEQLAGATTIGERIKRLLSAQDMSLSELSRRSGVAKGYLWELIQGSEPVASRMKPSAETLYAIGTVLGASVGDLLGKTLPTQADINNWPAGLREYVEQAYVPPDEARMLAAINTRGRTPTTSDEWRLLHQTIRMVSQGKDWGGAVADHEETVQALCQHHEEHDPKALILRLCSGLLEVQPTESGPTPLEVLGSVRCIRHIYYAPIGAIAGCSGVLAPDDGGYMVTLAEGEPPGRQRRSLAHEIVHTFFRDVHPGPAGHEEEQLCEVGAAELTMPAGRLRQFIEGRGHVAFDVVNEVAHEFGVTPDAAARRLVELSDEPVCYLVACMMRTSKQEQFGLGSPQLRVASWTWSASWPDQRPLRGLAVEAESLIGRAFRNQDFQAGHGTAGISYRDGSFDIQAAGYTFPQGGRARSQVAVLLRARTRPGKAGQLRRRTRRHGPGWSCDEVCR
jgi:transcriptional regulator with XRE-family HTH domain